MKIKKLVEENDSIDINEDATLEYEIGEMLISRKLTIATAESCTGGLLAGQLINYPGISSVYMDGIISYSNEAKINRLGVNPSTLEKYGAVSEEVATEMAVGVARTAGTLIGISTTGIAGPTGGTVEKPIGLVYVGLYLDGRIRSKKLNLNGTRREIREKTVVEALEFLKRELSINE